MAEEFLGRALLVDAAGIEEIDPRGDLTGEGHLMGGEIVAMPLCASLPISLSTSSTSSGSSADVASSSRMTLGRMAARARTRCCWLLERRSG